MAVESSRSTSSAESYIGSLISLTSKSQIRYEGVLYNINTDESSIGLKNVRSYGTEGRKKDGPQIPSSDKIYEYILFRGSDIKDLQVKAYPPPVQTPPSINNDPAIIQSNYPRPITVPSVPSSANGTLPDPTSLTTQLSHPIPGPTFQGGGIPLYQPGGNLGSWASHPPPPAANGGGLGMPMYWPGFYGPPNGLPNMPQQSLLRPPPGLPISHSLQHHMQYPGFNASLQTGGSNLLGPNVTEFTPPGLPSGSNTLNLSSMSLSSHSLPSSTSTAPAAVHASETLPPLVQNKAYNAGISSLNPTFPSLLPLVPANVDVSVITPHSKPNTISGITVPVMQAAPSGIPPVIGVSSSSQLENSVVPLLLTPGKLLPSGHTGMTSLQPSQTVARKDADIVHMSSSSAEQVSVSKELQPPILPLPASAKAGPKLNGTHFHSRNSYRGRERGRGGSSGSSSSVMRFTEEFDFIAMNEKFNKDEVWDDLGKSSNNGRFREEESGDCYDGLEFNDQQPHQNESVPKSENKSVYNKDDFFDTLSCNTLDRNSQGGRPKFSEQIKIDTETFGNFSRPRGGRGPFRGSRSRGHFYGRGYGYVGRGRGRGRAP